MQRLLEAHARGGALFGAHKGSVTVRHGVDLTGPALDEVPEAETGAETAR
jgi:hypothetical protein